MQRPEERTVGLSLFQRSYLTPSAVKWSSPSLVTKTMVLPHYQMVKDSELDGKRLYEDITYGDSYGRSFLVLPDGSYLLIKDGTETVWGEAYEIADGRIRRICDDGGSVSKSETCIPAGSTV